MSVLRALTKPLREVLHQRDQLREKAKDLPVHILQTALSGVGQALLLTDRVRTTIKRLTTSGDEETVHASPSATTTEPSPAPQAPPVEEAPRPARREPVIYAPRSPAVTEPLPGYGELTVASLRGRLRGQSIDQIRELLAYERANAGRTEVVRLYENRLAKLEAQSSEGM